MCSVAIIPVIATLHNDCELSSLPGIGAGPV